MTYREMVGQRLVVGLKGSKINEDFEALIRDYKIGNVIIFKENVENNEQIKILCEEIQALVKKHTNMPAFISIDQEGGMVTRLEDDAVNIPGAMAISATSDPSNAYMAGKMTGYQLRELGFNIDLAPVADINSNMDNPVIGVRSYGDSPEQVSDFACQMSKGIEEAGVLSVGKHFPGHGDTNVDSHLGLPEIDKALDELKKCELVPFKDLINSGISAIMTAHILFPQIESTGVPATMSRKIITDILKKELGFEGLVLSDCMEMKAIQDYYGTVNGARKALEAGVDLIFISHSSSLAREASDELVRALENGELDLVEFEASLEKIIRAKEKVEKVFEEKLVYDYEKNLEFSRALSRKSISPLKFNAKDLPDLGEDPLFISPKAFRATNVMNIKGRELDFAAHMEKVFGGSSITISKNPSEEEIERDFGADLDCTSIVMASYNAHLYEGQREVIKHLAKKGRPFILVALRNPYDLIDLPDGIYAIAAYEYTKQSLEVMEEVFRHDFVMSGSLPIKDSFGQN